MADIEIAGLVLIILNVACSYKGFTNLVFFENYKFEVDRILINKEYKRLVTSGFLHVSWVHLIFNMIGLYAFSSFLEAQLGSFYFLILYFVSLIGGNLLALFIHRQHGDYSSVGASGGVCGLIFASIALFPEIGIGFFGLPFSMPSWLYGVLFTAYSIYGIKSNRDNIGHEAHLGGALIGMLIAVLMRPNVLMQNYLPILAITVPTIVFIYFIFTKPQFLLIDNYFFKKHKPYYNIDHQYIDQKINKQKELDQLLDKISLKGLNSLTAKEKQKLEDYSK